MMLSRALIAVPFALGLGLPCAASASPDLETKADMEAMTPVILTAASPIAEAIGTRLQAEGPIELALAGAVGLADQPDLSSITIDSEAGALRDLYAQRDNEPVWLTGADGEARLAALVEVLRTADREGLSPNDYWVIELDALADLKSPEAIAHRDMLASAAVMRYARDIQTGRVAPSRVSVRAEIDFDRRVVDRVAAVEAAAMAPDLKAHMAGLAPDHPMYRDLREALAWAREEVAEGGWPQMPGGDTLEPGDRDDRVPTLRARLQASGDYLPNGVPSVAEMPEVASTADSAVDDTLVYDAALVASVEAFQERHGLLVDGIVGPRTMGALNVTAEQRLDQAVASMERWRWLPADLGDRFILVNVPEYRLRVFEGDRVVRQMDVIVGRSSRPTPLFSSALTWLEWNPTWTVPTSIAEKDYLPHLIEDPSYLTNKNMYVYAGWQPDSPMIDVHNVDWEEIGRGIRSFMLRQEPGPGNALGKVKFMMSNNFSVYLHDTPERHLFARTHRAYSSGCIRVQDPMWLADYLLQSDPRWNGHEDAAVMSHWRTTRMNMPDSMPLHVTYVSSRIGDDGRPMFFEDIYGIDAAMAEAIAAHRPERTQIALAD